MYTRNLARPRWWLISTLFTALIVLGTAPQAGAQYFGRNKVQYKTFNYKVLKTEHFDIYYYPEEEKAVEQAGRMAERWYARLSKLFQHSLSQRQPLILYAAPPDFQQTTTVPGEIGEGTGGFTESNRRRVVLPFAGAIDQTDHVLGHELVHAFQYDITSTYREGGVSPAAEQMPLWFIEGMAEYFSLGPVDPQTAMWMRDAIIQKDLPDVKKLNNTQRYFPYRYGQALLAYIGGRWGDETIPKILKDAAQTHDLNRSIKNVLKETDKQLSEDWHAALHEAYDGIIEKAEKVAEVGTPIPTEGKEEHELNVGPVLSPDGSRVALFSSRNLFSIDLFVVDPKTGRIVQRLTKTALNSHFSSLEFIDSAGAWDPDGKRFAFAAVSEGRPHLVIVSAETGKIERDIPFPKLGMIYTPSWSPDGQRIAFSATAGGLSDLFIYDLQDEFLDQVTDDFYAELMPAWSPDGKSIAFVTDRFNANLSLLRLGNYRLALFDVATGNVTPLPGFEEARNLNPQWAPDGKSLYFLSNPDGIPNVYQTTLADGGIRRITNLATGVSGITATSPSFSVASRSGSLALSAYQHGDFLVYTTDGPPPPEGQPLPPTLTSARASLLPPVERPGSEVPEMLTDFASGLPETANNFEKSNYKPHLSFESAAQPYIVAGSDPFGSFVGGGTALSFSDMLGEHRLDTLFQITGGFKDIAGIASYQNQVHRWNWGGAIEQIPYRTGYFSSGTADVNGQPVYVDQQEIYRQTNRGLIGLVSYPFSPSKRVEFSGAARRISFEAEQQTLVTDPFSGQILLNQKQTLPSPSALNIGQASAAFVGDASIYGVASPIYGERYRLEVSPAFGSLDLTNVLADYRRYFMPVRPYTIAFRALHYGRYGSGAEDERLLPLFLGYPNLVRGYETNSFSTAECVPNATSSCPQYDRLLGSRVLVGNVELRFPIYGIFHRGSQFYGPIPVEGFVFTDAGVAWDSGQKPDFFGGDRRPVSSSGLGLRINALGFAVFELDFVKPWDRPVEGWHWQFNLISGF